MYYHLIEKTNTDFMELTEVDEILVENNKVVGISLSNNKEKHTVLSNYIIAAPGRGGAEWLSKQAKKLKVKLIIMP